MKLFKPTYKDKAGKTKKCQHWYLTFVDNRGTRRRFPAYSNKTASEKLGQRIDEILSSGGSYSPDLQKWIENLPEKMRNNLIRFGVIDSAAISSHIGKTLDGHLEDFRASLLAKGNTQKYADQCKARLDYIFSQCNFTMWSNIDANKIYTFLAELRKDKIIKYEEKNPVTGQLETKTKTKEGIGQRTFNCYLKFAKQFSRWMIKERRATINPLEHLGCITQNEKRRQRRALTLDEQVKLLQKTETGETHHYLTGYERVLVYTLALQTGLRANELRNLTVSCFDFKENIVTLTGAYTKNKKLAVIDLKPETAAALKKYLSGKLPTVTVFNMPDQPSKMMKIDIEAAGIPYTTDEGTADFHSLRHAFITNLARQGVHPSDAQALARHSSITLTMNLYTHSKRESLRKIINEQPDLTVNREEDKKIG